MLSGINSQIIKDFEQISGVSNDKDQAQSSEKPETGQEILDKDAFLKLLITQLRHQDPLNPVDDKEFIAQTAQFSALEQMQNINDNLKDVLSSREMADASVLIGKEIEALNQDGQVISGEVSGVSREEGNLFLIIEGDLENKVKIENVNQVF